MDNNRINEIIALNKTDISALMAKYDPDCKVIDFSQMSESLSNTGYKVVTNEGKFLLKLYSSSRDGIECAMYRYLKGRVNVPELYYFDNSKQFAPFSYAIFEFIEGVTLAEYVRQKQCFPMKIAYEIGSICATIHKRTYTCNAWLDAKLQVSQELPNFRGKLQFLLNEKPAKYLKQETVTKLIDFANTENALFDRLDRGSVLSHGDFTLWNIMISNETAYCIDFEYSCSDSRYRDIGHFFRRKDLSIESLLEDKTYQAFAEGYNSISETKLPSDWLKLARVNDIVTMLALLLNDHFPMEWVSDIEADIHSTLRES